LFFGLPQNISAFQWHNDSFAIPSGATQLASSEQCFAQAFQYHRAYAVQFHPEVTPAIVDEWCQYYGDCADISKAFHSAYDHHSQQSRRLLHNFYLNSQPMTEYVAQERGGTHG
jgi:GMP synthase-like glutamine amidotransferase